MTTLRKQARSENAAIRRKAVIKPVLIDPFELKWPEVSQAGLVDIEKALRDVLWPLVEARQAQYSARECQNAEAAAQNVEHPAAEQQPDEMLVDDSSAPTDTAPAATEAEGPEVDVPAELVNAEETSSKKRKVDDAWPKQISKRAKVRAAKFAKAERMAAKLQGNGVPLSSHEINLRSGRALIVPDNNTPERFKPTFLLDKRAAIDARPAICSALTLGINAVTAILEHDVENARRELAGLKPAPAHKRDNLDLRLFIPAPNKSTRRQRRELRQKLIPISQPRKRKQVKCSTGQREIGQSLPQFLHNVPAGDPAVLHVLQEALQEISNRITTKLQPSRRLTAVQAVLQEIITIASGDTPESQQSVQPAPTSGDQTAMALDAAPGGVVEHGGSRLSLETIKTVNLPSTLLYTIFCGKPTAQALRTGYYRKSLISDSHLQDLTALLIDYDREWFAVHEQYVYATQTLEQPVQQAHREIKQHISRMQHADQAESGALVDTFSTSPRFRIIFVAKGDINPLSIVQHVLTAAAARNAANISLRRIRANSDSYASPEDVYVVPLPKGAESKLAELLGIRRVAVFAIEDSNAPGYDALLIAVQSHVAPPIANWLVPTVNAASASQTIENAEPGRYMETHIKHLQVTVPVDPKAQRKAKREHNRASKARMQAKVTKQRSFLQDHNKKPAGLNKDKARSS